MEKARQHYVPPAFDYHDVISDSACLLLPVQQCELYHWIDVLDRFDKILEQVAKHEAQEPNSAQCIFMCPKLEDLQVHVHLCCVGGGAFTWREGPWRGVGFFIEGGSFTWSGGGGSSLVPRLSARTQTTNF